MFVYFSWIHSHYRPASWIELHVIYSIRDPLEGNLSGIMFSETFSDRVEGLRPRLRSFIVNYTLLMSLPLQYRETPNNSVDGPWEVLGSRMDILVKLKARTI